MVFDQLRNQECRCHRSTAVFRGDRSIAGRKAPRGGRFYDRSSALSGHRKIHRRQQGPVQYFGHRCFLKKIVERNSHGFRYLRKNGYFAIVTWGYFWKKRSDSFGFQDNGFRKTTPESQVKGHRVKNIEGNRGKLGAQNIWKYRALKSDYFLFNRAEFPSTSGAHVRRHEIQK